MYCTSTYCTVPVHRKRQTRERIGNQGANQQVYAFCYFPYSIEEPQAPFQLGIFSFLKAFPHIGKSNTGTFPLGLTRNPSTVQTGISMNAEVVATKTVPASRRIQNAGTIRARITILKDYSEIRSCKNTYSVDPRCRVRRPYLSIILCGSHKSKAAVHYLKHLLLAGYFLAVLPVFRPSNLRKAEANVDTFLVPTGTYL